MAKIALIHLKGIKSRIMRYELVQTDKPQIEMDKRPDYQVNSIQCINGGFVILFEIASETVKTTAPVKKRRLRRVS